MTTHGKRTEDMPLRNAFNHNFRPGWAGKPSPRRNIQGSVSVLSSIGIESEIGHKENTSITFAFFDSGSSVPPVTSATGRVVASVSAGAASVAAGVSAAFSAVSSAGAAAASSAGSSAGVSAVASAGAAAAGSSAGFAASACRSEMDGKSRLPEGGLRGAGEGAEKRQISKGSSWVQQGFCSSTSCHRLTLNRPPQFAIDNSFVHQYNLNFEIVLMNGEGGISVLASEVLAVGEIHVPCAIAKRGSRFNSLRCRPEARQTICWVMLSPQ